MNKNLVVRFFSKSTSAVPHTEIKTKGYFDNSPTNMRLKHRFFGISCSSVELIQ